MAHEYPVQPFFSPRHDILAPRNTRFQLYLVLHLLMNDCFMEWYHLQLTASHKPKPDFRLSFRISSYMSIRKAKLHFDEMGDEADAQAECDKLIFPEVCQIWVAFFQYRLKHHALF